MKRYVVCCRYQTESGKYVTSYSKPMTHRQAVKAAEKFRTKGVTALVYEESHANRHMPSMPGKEGKGIH